MGAHTIALTGYEGGLIKDLADECLIVPSSNMQHIEDCHLIYHGIRDHVAELQPAGAAT